MSKLYYETDPTPIKEVGFGTDDYKEPKVLTKMESIEQIFRNGFSTRRGTYPSMPHIGINIRDYLYNKEVDTESLRQEIYDNFSSLFFSIDFDAIVIETVNYKGDDILLVIIPVTIDEEKFSAVMSFRNGDGTSVITQFAMAAEENKGGF